VVAEAGIVDQAVHLRAEHLDPIVDVFRRARLAEVARDGVHRNGLLQSGSGGVKAGRVPGDQEKITAVRSGQAGKLKPIPLFPPVMRVKVAGVE
jgi:hypothetical protein